MSKPRVGGEIKGTPWVGGSQIDGDKRKRPKSRLAWRPEDFKGGSRVEEACQEGLRDERKLDLDDKGDSIMLTSWIQCIKTYMEETGMDTVFRILKVGRATMLET